MIPLFRNLVQALLYDELAARRWIRGLLLGVAMAGAQLAAAGDAAALWTTRQWAIRIVFALFAAAAGMVTAGERNARPAAETPPAPPSPGFIRRELLWSAAAIAVVVIAVVVATARCNRGREAVRELARRDEAAEVAGKLQAAGSGAAVASRSEQALARAFLEAQRRGDELSAELARVQAAAPGAKPAAAVTASTGGVVAGGAPRPAYNASLRSTDAAGTATPNAAPEPTSPPPQPSGGGGSCLLVAGDVGEVRVRQLVLETREGNRIAAGVGEAWRLAPAPATRLFGGPLRVESYVEKAPPAAAASRWGVGPWVGASQAGLAYGAAVAAPQLRLWSLELDVSGGGGVGPGGGQGSAQVIARF